MSAGARLEPGGRWGVLSVTERVLGCDRRGSISGDEVVTILQPLGPKIWREEISNEHARFYRGIITR